MKIMSLLIAGLISCQIQAMEEKTVDLYNGSIILDGPPLTYLQANQAEQPHNVIVFQDPASKEYKNVYDSVVQRLQAINPEDPESVSSATAILTCTNLLQKIQSTINTTLLIHTYLPNDDYNIFKLYFYNNTIPAALGMHLRASKNSVNKDLEKEVDTKIQNLLQQALLNAFVLEYLSKTDAYASRNKPLEVFVINLLTNTMQENSNQTINIPIKEIPIEKNMVGKNLKRDAFVHHLTEQKETTNFTKKLIKNGIAIDFFKGEGKKIIFQISFFKEENPSKKCIIQ